MPAGTVNNPFSFKEALERSASVEGRRHLLLGNGFSRACRNDLFSYDALFDQADFESAGASQYLRSVFHTLDTRDFEKVMRLLRDAAALADAYPSFGDDLSERLRRDADALREILAKTIADNHPSRPFDIADEQYAACKRFLSNFDRNGSIYTLNYDLLLYWTLMQSGVEPQVHSDDGFREPDANDTDYVTWEVDKTDGQRIFHLHGALYVFDAGAEIQKYTWIRTNDALIDQIRQALKSDRFPLIVSEGTSNEKLARIQHSNYLGRAYRSFAKIGGSLFIYGHSMSDHDNHILRLIERGNLKALFVGLYGTPDSCANRLIAQRCDLMKRHRGANQPLGVFYYGAQSADVWGNDAS